MADAPVTHKEKVSQVKVGGLWKFGFEQDGKKLTGLSGPFLSTTTKLVILPNKWKKEGSREPDYLLYLESYRHVKSEKGDVKDDGVAQDGL